MFDHKISEPLTALMVRLYLASIHAALPPGYFAYFRWLAKSTVQYVISPEPFRCTSSVLISCAFCLQVGYWRCLLLLLCPEISSVRTTCSVTLAVFFVNVSPVGTLNVSANFISPISLFLHVWQTRTHSTTLLPKQRPFISAQKLISWEMLYTANDFP